MGKQFEYWGEGLPELLPDLTTTGFDYWGEGEPVNPTYVALPPINPEAARSASTCHAAQMIDVLQPAACISQTASPGPGAVMELIYPAPEHSSSLCPATLIMGLVFPNACRSLSVERETILKEVSRPGMFLVF